MYCRSFVLLSAAASMAQPAGAQERSTRVEVERDAARARALPRILQMSRAPRAMLGVSTGSSGVQDTLGVLVSGVTEDGPAAKAGIREGSRLQAIGGTSLRVSREDADDPIVGGLGMRRLTRELGKRKPGDEVELRVADGGQSRVVRVRLADADSLMRQRVAATIRGPGGSSRGMVRARAANRASLGIQVSSSGSRRDTLGVFVAAADDEGPAAKAGIVEGARIAAIDGIDLRVAAADADDNMVASSRVQRLMRTLADVKPGDEVELRVWQNGQYRTTRVRTVPADSLRGRRSTFIIGDGMRLDGAPLLPARVRVPEPPEAGLLQRTYH